MNPTRQISLATAQHINLYSHGSCISAVIVSTDVFMVSSKPRLIVFSFESKSHSRASVLSSSLSSSSCHSYSGLTCHGLRIDFPTGRSIGKITLCSHIAQRPRSTFNYLAVTNAGRPGPMRELSKFKRRGQGTGRGHGESV
jgi:hypothetical protein